MRRHRRREESSIELYGISDTAMRELSQYNGEVARGLVHTPEWRDRMAILQQRYNDAVRSCPDVSWIKFDPKLRHQDPDAIRRMVGGETPGEQ